MTVGSTKLLALGVGIAVVGASVALYLTKRHDKRLAVARAVAVAAVQQQVASATGLSAGTARGIRIPFYEGEAQQPTSVMLGRTAEPVEGGRYLVSDLRVESYAHGPAGMTTNFVIEAPQCLIDPARKIASSPGRIVVSRTDGSFMTTGIGFEWRQLDSILSISNEVTTHLTRDGFNPIPIKKP